MQSHSIVFSSAFLRAKKVQLKQRMSSYGEELIVLPVAAVATLVLCCYLVRKEHIESKEENTRIRAENRAENGTYS